MFVILLVVLVCMLIARSCGVVKAGATKKVMAIAFLATLTLQTCMGVAQAGDPCLEGTVPGNCVPVTDEPPRPPIISETHCCSVYLPQLRTDGWIANAYSVCRDNVSYAGLPVEYVYPAEGGSETVTTVGDGEFFVPSAAYSFAYIFIDGQFAGIVDDDTRLVGVTDRNCQ